MSVDRSTQKMLGRALPILERLQAIERPSMVEVGVFTGFMSAYLLEQHPGLVLHGVDNWLGRESHSEAYRTTGDVHANATPQSARSWRDQALQRLRPMIDSGRMMVHQCHSLEAAGRFEPESVDLCYLDADHSYQGVVDDISAWWPAVLSGGWIGGDDMNHTDPRFRFGVDQAVAEFVNGTGLQLELHDGYMNQSWFVRKP